MTESGDEQGLQEGEERLSHATIRERALSGAALIAGRSVLLLVMAVAANAVLARELSPRQFGLVAFGMAIMTFAAALSDGGLGSALIRKSVAIDQPTLGAVFGLELTVTLGLFSLIAFITLPFFGMIGQLTTVMALSLPIGALVTPAQIVLERSLAYRTLARLEVLQSVAYYGFAIASVSLGMGVWGLAAASVVRTASSVLLIVFVRRDLLVRPLFSLARVRPLMRFGLHFQANGFVTVLRDQGLNVGIAVIGGTTTLGIWSLVTRLLSLPFLLFQTLWRVSFPAMSQLIGAGSDARSLVERGAGDEVSPSGFILATFAASGPGLVPAVFGERWPRRGPSCPSPARRSSSRGRSPLRPRATSMPPATPSGCSWPPSSTRPSGSGSVWRCSSRSDR